MLGSVTKTLQRDLNNIGLSVPNSLPLFYFFLLGGLKNPICDRWMRREPLGENVF